ncbi:MAG: hypothetical protein RL722_499 [Pseudomonadota bacterium]|jgi:hypothetical protein
MNARTLPITLALVMGLLPLASQAQTPPPAASAAPSAHPGDPDDPAGYVRFVEEFAGNCVNWSGVQIQVKNVHPSRSLRVWLDREYMGKGTGDRSRSLLRPGAEAEPLGCSRVAGGAQGWKIVKVQWAE